MDYTVWAIDQHKGEPFTAGDLIDMMKTKWKSIPSVREVGMVLRIGKEGTLNTWEKRLRYNQRMLEQAELTAGLRKVSLYVAVSTDVRSGENTR